MTKFIQYRIEVANAYRHYFAVTCQITQADPAGQIFRLPAWIPGSYLIREFARHISNFRAEADGIPIAWKKISKDSWQCAPTDQPLTVHYQVYALDWSVRAAYLDTTRAYWNGACVFMYPDGLEEQACQVEIIKPSDSFAAPWRVATSLPKMRAENHGFGWYQAENYDALIDHPVEISDFQCESFLAGGIPHDLVLIGRNRVDLTRVASDLATICQWHIDLWGSKPPMDYYLFQVLLTEEGYGGLEHRASTTLMINRSALPTQNPSREDFTCSEEYRKFLGLASHEYFHTWNVKRLKPSAFVPYDLTRENYTAQLWWFEGITSYYDDLALVRTGLITPADYLICLGKTLTNIRRGAGRAVQSVAEASFDTWIKYYRPDENTPNSQVSYYLLGSLVGLLLDLTLRVKTPFSLDDLVQLLWLRYGDAKLPRQGVPEEGIMQALAELTGFSWEKFFTDHIYGKEELPLTEYLAHFGIQSQWKTSGSGCDPTLLETSLTEMTQPPVKPWLGARLGAELKVTHVLHGGSAETAGLNAGDQLVALNDWQLTQANLESTLQSYPVGDQVKVHFFRRQELCSATMSLLAAPSDTAQLNLDPQATPEQIARRKSWLGQ